MVVHVRLYGYCNTQVVRMEASVDAFRGVGTNDVTEKRLVLTYFDDINAKYLFPYEL